LLEQEVREYVGRGRYERREEGDGKGHSQGSEVEQRKGYGKPRSLTTGVGTAELPQTEVTA